MKRALREIIVPLGLVAFFVGFAVVSLANT